jgi:hypothetical protein
MGVNDVASNVCQALPIPVPVEHLRPGGHAEAAMRQLWKHMFSILCCVRLLELQ